MQKLRLLKHHLYANVLLQSVCARCENTNYRHGDQWQWYSRYRSCAENQQKHSDEQVKKKAQTILPVNPHFRTSDPHNAPIVTLERVCEEAELDEQWSYVGNKSNQRWLWYAIDHASNTVLAFVFGKRKDQVFRQLQALLKPLGIRRYYTDDWGAYERHLPTAQHEIGKRNTQKIERKNLNLRTWIKRLTRRTICFSKCEIMHDTVIGLLINKVEFGMDIHAKQQV